MSDLRARPTMYKGIQMRSRLEARFAAFMDWRGWTWEYEPRAYAGDGGQYLPDFLVTSEPLTVFIEVKPTVTAATEIMDRMEVIWESEPEALLVVVTANGPAFCGVKGFDWDYQVIGGWPR